MKIEILESPINPDVPLDNDDFITDINKQVKYLQSKNLQITSQKNVVNLLQNYGFNKLFRAYSKPFVIVDKNNDATFKKGVSENDIHLLYHFDNNLKNIINLLLNSFESKLGANISHEINEMHPDIKTQFWKIWSKKNEQKSLIKNIQKKYEEGSLYLIPFINKKIYPAWIVLDTLTLSDKCFLMDKINKNHGNEFKQILKNFRIQKFLKYNDFQKIIFDIIRPFQNTIAHYDRLMHFEISFANKKNMRRILQSFFDNFPTLKNTSIFKNYDFKINSFHLIIILAHFLNDDLSTKPTKQLIANLDNLINQTKNEINDFQVLTNQEFYNWPKEWKTILQDILKESNNY